MVRFDGDLLPFGPRQGESIKTVPLSYVRWLASHEEVPDPKFNLWIERAKEELGRRGKDIEDDGIHFSEHAVERFSTRAMQLRTGIITKMKREFKQACRFGKWISDTELV